MATPRDDVVQAGLEMLIDIAGVPVGKAVRAGSGMPKRGKPFVTVRATTLGEQVGSAERLDGESGGNPTSKMRDRRRATLSFQGYGADSVVWLDKLQSRIDAPESIERQVALGVSLTIATGLAEISALLDTGEEQRFSLELRATYLYDSETATGVPLQRVELETTLARFEGDPATLAASLALDENGQSVPP